MPQAISNREQLAYIAEATWGTFPATPNGRIARYNSIADTQTYSTTQSGEITNARQVADTIFTDAKGGLSVKSEFSYDPQYEDWMLALLACSAWAANVAKVGTTRTSFAFERGFVDITQFLRYTGCIPVKMAWNIQNGAVISCDTTFDSKFPTTSAATAWTGTSAAGSNSVMSPIDSVQLMQEGGGGAMAGVTDFSMEIANGLADFNQLTSLDPLDLQPATLSAMGTFSLYFADATYWTKYIARTRTSLQFVLGGAANKKYAFLFPNVALTAATMPNPGMNKPIVQKFSWVANFNAANSAVQITRTP